ncbi:MAG: hypothetical protein HYY11_03455 [Candidatus Methylomirabilis oxyfera]|nr:hypothetical protein [Candidatus Methylomirabilis oxyfera]
MRARSATITIAIASVITLRALTASAEIPQVPIPPTDLTLQSAVTGQAGRSITIRWRDASTNEGGFAIERRVNPPQEPWKVIHQIVRSRRPGSTEDPGARTGQMFSWTDGGVAVGVEYCYRIRVLSASGDATTPERCLKPDPGRADLTVVGGSIYKGQGYARGDPSYVTIKIKNAGTVFARDFYVRVTGGLPGRTGVELRIPIDQLNAGTERELKQFLDIGDVKQVANCCTLRIEVDPDNRVQESNKTNNKLFLTTEDPSGP